MCITNIHITHIKRKRNSSVTLARLKSQACAQDQSITGGEMAGQSTNYNASFNIIDRGSDIGPS